MLMSVYPPGKRYFAASPCMLLEMTVYVCSCFYKTAGAPHVTFPMLFDENAATEAGNTCEDNIKMDLKYFIWV